MDTNDQLPVWRVYVAADASDKLDLWGEPVTAATPQEAICTRWKHPEPGERFLAVPCARTPYAVESCAHAFKVTKNGKLKRVLSGGVPA